MKVLSKHLTNLRETEEAHLKNEEAKKNDVAEIPVIPHEEDSSDSSVLSPPQVRAPK